MTEFHKTANFEERLDNVARGEADAEMEHHISDCASCQEEIATIRSLIQYQATMADVTSVPEESLYSSLYQLMPKVRPDLAKRSMREAPKPLAALRRIVADLILDTGATPQVAGLRSGSAGATQQFTFVSDVADLDMEASPVENGWLITGQLGMDEVPGDLSIRFYPVEHESDTLDATVSDEGYFELNLPAGEWSAAVELQDAVVQFPGIRL